MGRKIKGRKEVLWDPSDRRSQVPKYPSPGESLPVKANVISLLGKAAQSTRTFAGCYRKKKHLIDVTTGLVPCKSNILMELPKVVHLILF